jgi:hypothetical protein
MNRTRKNKCKIFLATVSTKQHPNLERFIKSAKKHGFNPKILGLHEKKTYKDPLIGKGEFGMKLRYLYKYSKSLRADDIVLFTDAWDVLIIGDCEKVYKDYKSFNKDIVFGGETIYGVFYDIFNIFNIFKLDLSKPFPCLNAGVIVGRAGAIRDLIQKYTEKTIDDSVDDQILWRKIYLENRDKITIDSKAKLVLNTCLTSKNNYVYEDNIFTYKGTNTQPSIIHAQGPEKLGFKDYLKLIKY